MKEYFLIAKIVSAYGKEGFVKVSSYSDFPERFSYLKNVYIDFFGNKKTFTVESAVTKKDSILLKFANFFSAEDVKVLIGREVFVDESDVIKLPDDTYFIHDLVGSEIFEDNIKLGIIKDVLVYPANDIYVIETDNGGELLFPAVKELIERFDPVNKIMILKPGSSEYDED